MPLLCELVNACFPPTKSIPGSVVPTGMPTVMPTVMPTGMPTVMPTVMPSTEGDSEGRSFGLYLIIGVSAAFLLVCLCAIVRKTSIFGRARDFCLRNDLGVNRPADGVGLVPDGEDPSVETQV